MFNKKITGMYFSPTGTTKKVVSGIAARISENINDDSSFITVDFTLPKDRQEPVTFQQETLSFSVFRSMPAGFPMYY